MLEELDVQDGHRVWDVGTGTGYLTALLCTRLGSRLVHSSDIAPALSEAARTRLASLGHTPHLTVHDARDPWDAGEAGEAGDAAWDTRETRNARNDHTDHSAHLDHTEPPDHPGTAVFDRVIATCSVRSVPAAWLRRRAPAGPS